MRNIWIFIMSLNSQIGSVLIWKIRRVIYLKSSGGYGLPFVISFTQSSKYFDSPVFMISLDRLYRKRDQRFPCLNLIALLRKLDLTGSHHRFLSRGQRFYRGPWLSKMKEGYLRCLWSKIMRVYRISKYSSLICQSTKKMSR